MHSITEFEGNIPAFLAKLWNMVEEPNLDDLIAWGSNGLSFVIKDQNKFAKELLPMYYKHNNMASFIRQLNMYGFHKNISLESGCAKMEDVIIEFYHPCFQKNNPNLLQNIKRKINAGRSGGSAGAVAAAAVSSSGQPSEGAVKQVLHDVRKMKSRQDSVDSRLAQMKMENEALWREVAVLRQKHIKQQQIVNKLIQFLVSFVQHPHANGITVNRRNIPLMLQDRSAHRNQLNKNNQSLSGISEMTMSPTGPVIHEIDPNEYAASLLLSDVGASEGSVSSSPQHASSMLVDTPITQETSAIDNDESLGADVSEEEVAKELLDLPNQLLAESADQADGAAQSEQLFARPNRIRGSRRRPRKPSATKKLSYKVADEVADQPDITGLVLDDFPLIIPGSQALEQLTNLPTTDDVITPDEIITSDEIITPDGVITSDEIITSDDVITSPQPAAMTSPIVNLTPDSIVATPDDVITSPQTVTIEAMTSPIVNLTADSIVTTSPYTAEFTDPNTVIPATIVNSAPTIVNSAPTILNSAPTIVNRTVVPIVAPQKTGRYKKIAPKLTIPEQRSQVKVIRPQQRKRKSSAESVRTAGKKAKFSPIQDGGKSRTEQASTMQDGGQSRTEQSSPSSATVSNQMNNDRTVACCMAPSNSQQSIKQEIDNHVDSLQNDLDTLKELLKGESISLDANTLLGKLSSSTLSHYLTLNKNEGYDYDVTTDLLFNSEDPFSMSMDLQTQTQTEDKSKEPDNNQLVSYTTPSNSSTQLELGDLFDDWILSPPHNEAEAAEDDDVYDQTAPELNTPDILMTPDPQPKRRKKK